MAVPSGAGATAGAAWTTASAGACASRWDSPPATSWGLDVASGKNYMFRAWWLVTFPGIAISITVLAINLIGGQRPFRGAGRQTRREAETTSGTAFALVAVELDGRPAERMLGPAPLDPSQDAAPRG